MDVKLADAFFDEIGIPKEERPDMVERLNQTASDLAIFNSISPEEMLAKLRVAINGDLSWAAISGRRQTGR